MGDEEVPKWWQMSADPSDEEDAIARYFAPPGAPGGDDAEEDDILGMPMAALGDGNVGHLSSIDAEIARLEAELRENGLLSKKPDHMEGDDEDPSKKKKFMTIRDLKPTPLFDLFGAPPPQEGVSPDAVVDTGRRLKDGAPFPAIRAPLIFGVDTPIYLHDLLLPVALLFGAVCLVIGYFWTEKCRAYRKLELEQQSNDDRSLSDERLRHLLTALLLKQTTAMAV